MFPCTNCSARYHTYQALSGHLTHCRTLLSNHTNTSCNILDILNRESESDVDTDMSEGINVDDNVWEDVECDETFINFAATLLDFKKELTIDASRSMERLQHYDLYLHTSSCNLSDMKASNLLSTVSRMFARQGINFNISVKNWYYFRRKLELPFRCENPPFTYFECVS